MKSLLLLALSCVFINSAQVAAAAIPTTLTLHPLFTDHAVLQAGLPLPIWGWDKPHQNIRVSFAGQNRQTTANAEGRWIVQLEALPVDATSRALTVVGSSKVVIQDLLVGEVWLGSGQSNMEWALSSAKNGKQEAAGADYPNIRLFNVPHTSAFTPQEKVNAQWKVCTPESAATFSAVLYLFGRQLHTKLRDTPVGLIHSSWGGTPAQSWTSAEALENNPELKHYMESYYSLQKRYAPDVAAYQKQSAAYRQRLTDQGAWLNEDIRRDPGISAEAADWMMPDLKTSPADWPKMEQPTYFQNKGLSYNGAIWFRREVKIPAAWVRQPLKLSLGVIDDHDITYVNGKRVGGIGAEDPNAYAKPRSYSIPAELVSSNSVTIAIRIFDHKGMGGFVGPGVDMQLRLENNPAELPLRLTGEWSCRTELAIALPPLSPSSGERRYVPSTLFNGMIAPLLPYAMRGVIWYQGEGNTGAPREYFTLLKTLITDWRSRWGQGNFPFLIVQLANYHGTETPLPTKPSESNWAELRLSQAQVRDAVTNTGLAVAIDIGDPHDIHPLNKQDVALRLSSLALADTYNIPTLSRGPSPLINSASVTRKGIITLPFKDAGAGLVAKGDLKQNIAVAGPDQLFYWADIQIKGENLIISNPQVPQPRSIRYAWANSPQAHLYNSDGLPAEPFQATLPKFQK